MHSSRLRVLTVFAAGWLASAAPPSAPLLDQPEILVVVRMGPPAYHQVLEGFRAGIGAGTSVPQVTLVDLSSKDRGDGLARVLASPSLRAVVSVGPEALEAMQGGTGKIPWISTLVLQSDAVNGAGSGVKARPVATLSLDVPIEAVMRELHRAFPDKTRIGVLRNSRKPGPPVAVLQAAAKTAGFSIVMTECSRPEDLLESFQSLRNRVDFVWCIPDSDLYTGATVRSLLMSSIRNRIPIIGFSESFVQSGAVLGVYPDFEAVGRQTADLVRKYLSGSPVPSSEKLKSVRACLNLQVARLLGLRPAAGYSPETHASLP